MAVPGIEVEIIKGGTEGRPIDRGRWVQNMWRPKGHSDWQSRPGFGQVAQIDTTMRSTTTTPGSSSDEYGFSKHLGSHLVQSKWGSEQIVSIFLMSAQSGTSQIDKSSKWGSYYSVTVYDIATTRTYEQVLFRHTSENKTADFGQYNEPRMYDWYGCYETNENTDNQSFLYGIEEPFYFTVYQNELFFGNRFTGLLVYRPADFRELRDKTVDSDQKIHWVKGYSEACLVTRVVPVDGLASAQYNYLQKQDFPAPVAVSSFQNRFVVAAESHLIFSDVNIPNSFIDANQILVPSQEKVTAVAAVGNMLMVFTEKETLAYQAPLGDLASAGRFTVVSRSVGCLSPRSVVSVGAGIFWADSNGVYSSVNGFEIKELSEPINQFFKGGMTSPLSHYLTDSGIADPSTFEQPRTLYRQTDTEDVSITYSQDSGCLFLSYPSSNALWCLSGDGWSLWPVESAVKEVLGVPTVGIQDNINNPYVISGKSGLFLIGSVEGSSFVSATASGGEVYTNSYYIMELGRGGALDRSVLNEDYRTVFGAYKKQLIGDGDTRVYFGQPALDAVTGSYWLPVEIVPDYNIMGPIDGFNLVFGYESALWTPGGTPVIPPERRNLTGAALTFTVTPATQTISISYGPAASSLNMAAKQRNILLYIKMEQAVASATALNYGFDFTVAGGVASVVSSGVTKSAAVYIWDQHFGPLHKDNDVTQPVDWAYKSVQIGVDSAARSRARGLFTRMISHGNSQAPIAPSWPWGVYNTLLGADWKGWSSQVLDFTSGIVSIANKFTLRTRYRDDSSVDLQTRTFNKAAVYGDQASLVSYVSGATTVITLSANHAFVIGDVVVITNSITAELNGTFTILAVPAANSLEIPVDSSALPGGATSGILFVDNAFLIDDEEHNIIATSDSVKGSYLSYMIFGFLRDRSEKVEIASSKALMRDAGSRRRTGR